MKKTVISTTLNEKDLQEAINKIQKYKKKLLDKFEKYKKRLSEVLQSESQKNFNASELNDLINGGMRKAEVSVSIKRNGDILVIVANGKDAVWCEFGAGIYHNGAAGSSPNPYGQELGFTIGSYGDGRGKYNAWGYYDENRNLIITRGTPASMPMYNAVKSLAEQSISIAREVFK